MSGGDVAGLVILLGAGAGAVYLAATYRREIPPQTYVTYERTGGGSSGGNKAAIFAPLIGAGIDGLFGLFGGGGARAPANTSQPGFVPDVQSAAYQVDRLPDVSAPISQRGGGVDGLLNLIGSKEAPKGYDQVYGGISALDQPPKPLTQMTVNEVLAWQDRIDSDYNSEAAGRYQVVEDTLRGLRDTGKVSGNAVFDVRTQDAIAVTLLERRGLRKYQSGQIDEYQFGQNLAQEWAILPAIKHDKWGNPAKGQSYYDGDGLNRSGVGIGAFLDVVRGVV